MNIKTDVQIGIAVSRALTSLALKNVNGILSALTLKIRNIFSRSVVEVQENGSITNNPTAVIPNNKESEPNTRLVEIGVDGLCSSNIFTISEIFASFVSFLL